jgi:dipeptidyl aminopeptidase/acylaminoacyl peptidase
MVILPSWFILGSTPPLPTLVYVYGGPTVQMVHNDFRITASWFQLHVYAHLGYCVVIVDNVGTSRRGIRFEGYLKSRLGYYEIFDQIDGLKFSTSNGFSDPNRVIISGSSYGGFLSLMSLATQSHIFKVSGFMCSHNKVFNLYRVQIAIATSPVTQWEGYDSVYTERYLGCPTVNKANYEASSILLRAIKFPNS